MLVRARILERWRIAVKTLFLAVAVCLFCFPAQADTFSIVGSNGSTLAGYTDHRGGFAYDNRGRSVTWTYQPGYRASYQAVYQPVYQPIYQSVYPPRSTTLYTPVYRPNLSFMGGYRLPIHNW